MKIGFTIGELNFKSGIVRVVYNIAIELSKIKDYEINILTTGCGSDESKLKFAESGLEVINLDIEKKGHRARYVYYSGAVYEKICKLQLDALVVSGTEHVLFYAKAMSKIRTASPRLYVWEHRNFSAGPKYRLEWWGKRYAVKNWDGIICITKKDYDQYRDYSINKDKIHQIYNLTDFKSRRETYNSEARRIVSCGYLSHIKGFDMLIDVAKEVFAIHSDWSWDIYGEGSERNNLQKLIEENNLQNNVFLKGYTSEINELYGQFSFLVMTSRSEGMGMVLIEAQKAGLPTISFDIKCGPSDVISNEVNGYLVSAFDIKEMTGKVNYLIENPEVRRKLSYNSEVNLAEFDKEYIISKWVKLLENR